MTAHDDTSMNIFYIQEGATHVSCTCAPTVMRVLGYFHACVMHGAGAKLWLDLGSLCSMHASRSLQCQDCPKLSDLCKSGPGGPACQLLEFK